MFSSQQMALCVERSTASNSARHIIDPDTGKLIWSLKVICA